MTSIAFALIVCVASVLNIIVSLRLRRHHRTAYDLLDKASAHHQAMRVGREAMDHAVIDLLRRLRDTPALITTDDGRSGYLHLTPEGEGRIRLRVTETPDPDGDDSPPIIM